MLKELILKNRSYRRFHEGVKIPRETILEWIDLARLSPSAKNMQALKFFISCDEETNDKIFPTLSWAGYLKDWPGPDKGERPAAYILILLDTEIKQVMDCDHGIAAQSIMLGAVEQGFGGCMIKNVNKDMIIPALNIPERYKVLLCLALGKPNEKIYIEKINESGDVKFWRDEQSGHHVPKRDLNDIVIKFD
jgi:nitroreductase